MNEPKPINVTIARFEDLVGRGLRAVVEGASGIRIVGCDVDHKRLGAALQAQRPEVAILDFGSLRSPVEVRELRSRYPETRLVLLANHPSSAECSQMLAFGANACLGKDTQARDILNAIHLASRGLQVLPHTEGTRESGQPPTWASELLTRREAEVLVMLREGLPNAQIAAALFVSVETVRTHARNIYRKLGVSSRRELLAPPAQSAPSPPERVVGSSASGDRYVARRTRRPSHN